MNALTLTALLSCGADEAPADTASDAAGHVEEAPLEHLYSFAVLADPHITTSLDPQERLAAAVAWINDNAAAEKIELVWVVGDIGWGEGLPVARGLLDELAVTYVPVIGDNEISAGSEQAFDDTFADHYVLLSTTLQGWQRGAVEVYNPVHDQTSWLQNFSFDYGGIHWVGLDWCSRDDNALLSEFAELHDFEGGTWPFFQDEIGVLEAGPGEDVLLFSHHPMHLGNFDEAQMEQITNLTGPVSERVGGAWAGHLHQDAEVAVDEGGYTVWVTDAVWDDEKTVRVVQVRGNGERFEYSQELVIVP